MAAKGTWSDVLGFSWKDVSSWNCLVTRLNQPMHPCNLAAFRIIFGILMTIDLFDERGFHKLDERFGDKELCHFALFDAIRPLRLEWMYVVYLVMLISCLCITIGFMYRLACLTYYLCYMYLFLLDKLSWNNHSYLYSLLTLQLIMMDGHRAWSIDGLLSPRIRYSHVPTWNYFLLRFQIFIVYFIAGLKKLDADWVGGYSVRTLSDHWVFLPFRLLLSPELTDHLVVHIGGLVIDFSSGFLLYFDQTRMLGFLIAGSFHVMNSRIFSIGMFPYAMLATMPLFCAANWPVSFFGCLPGLRDTEVQRNDQCVYQTRDKVKLPKRFAHGQLRWFHHTRTLGVVVYVIIQFFLPYSHFITKGYNNWTNGLYGYSWDMMVNSWSVQHTRVRYQNAHTQGYLDPKELWMIRFKAFVRGGRPWSSQADMVKQYATCVRDRLADRGLYNVQIYMDVWTSLNGRFQQRVIDPRVDLVRAQWHPLVTTEWLMPFLVDLSAWRHELDDIESRDDLKQMGAELVFVADFPGLSLENHVDPDFDNTSVTVLQGSLLVEIPDRNINISLQQGEKIQVPAGSLHVVHTLGPSPSCYMYMFVNSSHHRLMAALAMYEEKYNISTTNQTKPLTDASLKWHPMFRHYQAYKNESKSENKVPFPYRSKVLNTLIRVYQIFHKLCLALHCIYTKQDMASILPSDTISTKVEYFSQRLGYYFGLQ